MSQPLPMNPYPTRPKLQRGGLPDPFAPPGLDRIANPEAWPRCAERWKDLILDLEYGGMPPQPEAVTPELHCQNVRRGWKGQPAYWSYRLHCHGGERPIVFGIKLLFHDTGQPQGIVINGDACWWRSEEAARMVLERGYALLLFDRTELAKDLKGGTPGRDAPSGGLYDIYPGDRFGALSAWAWGYQRCVDFVHQLPFFDRDRIAVSGHSRGGKTTLLAGLTDPRISLIHDNASCAGGGAAFRYVGDGGETLSIVDTFPSWFGSGLRDYLDREDELPFDQHCLLASLAPRPLLLTYALDDRWSNPEGMLQCAWAAQEVYRFLGAEERIAFHLRPGGHSHSVEDWETLLDFLDWQWQGKAPRSAFNQHPYTHLQPAFAWSAPGGRSEAVP